MFEFVETYFQGLASSREHSSSQSSPRDWGYPKRGTDLQNVCVAPFHFSI